MDNQENGVTLGQLFSVFKKNLIRGLIYVLASVIVATAVLVIIKTFTSTNVYESTVSFSTAKTTYLSSMNLQKATVVNKALSADGKDISLSKDVVNNLSVSAVIPSDKEDAADFIPSSFIVSLKSSSDVKLSKSEYKSLLDNIAKEYVNLFASSSMPELLAVLNTESLLNDNAEYLQVAYSISDVIDDYLANLNSFVSANPAAANFADANTGKSLSSIISDLNLLEKSIDNLKSNIVVNKYGRGNLNDYLEIAKTSAAAAVAEYQKVYDAAMASVAAYKSTVESITKDNNGNNVYTFDDTVFATLVQQATQAAKQLGAADKKLTEINEFTTIVGTETGSSNTAVEEKLKDLSGSVSYTLNSYSSLAKEFNGNKAAISQATVSSPARATAESFITTKILLIADVAVVFIAYFVSFSQTFAVMKKKGEL